MIQTLQLPSLECCVFLAAVRLHGVARRSASGIMYEANFINTELDRVRPAVNALGHWSPSANT
jgi:hypothetical protein